MKITARWLLPFFLGYTVPHLLSAAELLPVEDAKAREALPEYYTIPAAKPEELTDANGWPSMESYGTWHRSHGGPTSNRFSTLKQINTENVKDLELAWVYHSKDGTDNIQCNPIVVDGVMFAPTGGHQMVALDATDGRELWRFAPELPKNLSLMDSPARRGLMYWPGDAENPARILFTCGYWIYALDPKTGRPVAGFGETGRTRLATGGTAGGCRLQTRLRRAGFQRRRLRLRRARRQAAVALPHHSGEGRIWLRDLGQPHRGRWRQFLGRHRLGRIARHRLHPDGFGQTELQRPDPPRRHALRQLPDCAQGRDRRAPLAFPGCAPRHLGPRHGFAAEPRHGEPARPQGRRGFADRQERHALPARSRDRETALSVPHATRADLARAGRSDRGLPAIAGDTRADHETGLRTLGHHGPVARGHGFCRAAGGALAPGLLRSAGCQPPDGDQRPARWHRLARFGLRSAHRLSLHCRQPDPVDCHVARGRRPGASGAGHGRGKRPTRYTASRAMARSARALAWRRRSSACVTGSATSRCWP